MGIAETLIDDHLDGTLKDDGFHQLANWLRASDAHVQQFVRECRIHSLLHDYVSQRQFQADALLRAMSSPRPEVRSAATVRPRSRWRRTAAIAAALLLIALSAGVMTRIALRPSVVAMLTQTANCRWAGASEALVDGSLLREGDELHLLDGRALITFSSGARVVLEGPTEFTPQSGMSAALTAGRLTSKVPLQAVGFTIHTPLAQLMDLGTEFTATIRDDETVELQVFTGMIELTVVSDDSQTAGAPLRVSEGVAVIVDGKSRLVRQIEYDANQRIALP